MPQCCYNANLAANVKHFVRIDLKEMSMETIKTALFETLVESAVPDESGGFTFTLEGKSYQIKDTLEISKIAQEHGYIIIY